MTTPRPARVRAFISYSHSDGPYLEQLQRHLKPLLRESNLQVWDDTQIQPGSNWREEIEQALASARVAILLVSAHFLASDFIAGEELPRMLEMAKNEGSRILPVIVSPSVFSHTKLSQFQTVNDPAQPLSTLPEYKQEEIWAQLAAIVYKELSMPADVPVLLPPSPPPGTTLLTYTGHSDSVRAVAWSPDSTRLASGSDDTTVQVWDVTRGQHLAMYEGHHSHINAVVWSPDGNWLGSNSLAPNAIQVWDAVSGQPRSTYEGYHEHVNAIAWSPDSTRLVSGGAIGRVEVWDAASGQSLGIIELNAEDLSGTYAVAWSPDGRRLASSSNLTVKLWDATSAQLLINCTGHARSVTTIAWAPDSRRLASGSYDGTVQVWNTNGHCLTTYAGQKDGGPVLALAWSPDGRRIASGGGDWRRNRDTTAHVWDAASGQDLSVYTGHVEPVYAIAWSPDGKYIASAGEDWTVQVWSASQQEGNVG